MSSKEQFGRLFAYHWFTLDRLLTLTSQLEDKVIHAQTGYGRGSIFELFYHILQTDQAWRMGMQAGRRVPTKFKKEDFASLEDLWLGVKTERVEWDAFLADMTPEDYDGIINLVDRSGQVNPILRWRIFQHVSLHGMQHFAEIAHLLTIQGKSPGDIDFIFFE